MITIKNLKVTLDNEQILHNISAIFPENKVTTIIGRNG